MAIHGTVRGTQFGRIDQPNDRFSENSVGEKIITRTYRTLWDSWLQESPKRGAQHPNYPKAKLETKDARQITPGFLCDVTLTYREPAADVTPEPGALLPEPRYSEVVSEGTVPIEQHPNFAAFATVENGAIFDTPIPPLLQGKFLGWTADSPYAGRLTYETGSVTESTTTYFWSRPSSVADLLNEVSGNWRVASGSIQKEGIYWSRTINRKYNPNGWPAAIYGS
jgi:hypothetical protein